MHWSYADLMALPLDVYNELIGMISDGDLKFGLGD